MFQDSFLRKELKFYVPSQKIGPLRNYILRYMEYDPFCIGRPNMLYSVRSIYFDTPHYLFFFEKIGGIDKRKKLRIRTYNEPNEFAPAFLEIKNKFTDNIFKERAKVPLMNITEVLDGFDNETGENVSTASRKALNKFIFLVHGLNLIPRVLISYEREAFVGLDDPDVRITFDIDVRSYPNPSLDDFFREADLITISDPYFILEIKFFNRMPIWTRQLVSTFGLQQESISKYCNGLEAWVPSLQGLGSLL